MEKYAMVLSDILYKEYWNFKNGYPFDRIIVESVLRYYQGTILTNVAQIERIGVKVPPQMMSQLARQSNRKKCLNDLSRDTQYKIVIGEDSSTFPCVNIFGDAIGCYLSGSFYNNTNRRKGIEHLQALCANVRKIGIYDKYLWRDSTLVIALFKELFPARKVEFTLYFHSMDSDQSWPIEVCDELKRHSTLWTFTQKQIRQKHHDRYLIIDDSVEVILTSGFDHLIKEKDDLTYIIKSSLTSHFL